MDVKVTPGLIAWGEARGCKSIDETILLFKKQYLKVLQDVAEADPELDDEQGVLRKTYCTKKANELREHLQQFEGHAASTSIS